VLHLVNDLGLLEAEPDEFEADGQAERVEGPVLDLVAASRRKNRAKGASPVTFLGRAAIKVQQALYLIAEGQGWAITNAFVRGTRIARKDRIESALDLTQLIAHPIILK
jgi:hypothetical protein